MANNIYAGNALTSGGAGSLDDISHSVLTSGDVAIITTSATELLYFYVFDATSGAAASSPDVIAPVSTSGDERWHLSYTQSFSSFFRDSAKATNLDEFYTGLGLKYDHMWIGAGAWNTNETAGAGFSGEEFATNDVTISYYGFDDTTQEYIEFDIVMPATWDRGTIKVKFHWLPTSAATAAEEVRWGLEGYAFTDGDEMDQAMGTPQEVTDTVLAGEDEALHISAATSALTIGGTPTLGDTLHFKAYRDPVHADDDMVGDANLLGITIEFANTNVVTAW